jgi:hypothetical protein
VILDTDDGREIIHGCKNTLDEAIAYLASTWGGALTRQERSVLEREDCRVRFRQSLKREPTTNELDEFISRGSL